MGLSVQTGHVTRWCHAPPSDHSVWPSNFEAQRLYVAAGEVSQLREDVVRKLDALAAEMRRAMAAASLAQSVAALGPAGSGRGGGMLPRGSGSPTGGSYRGMTRIDSGRGRRRQWSYGQLTSA